MELLDADKMKHLEIWRVLKANGWTWINGRGLVTYCYVRPNRSDRPPYVEGIDFFTSLDAVTEYVQNAVKVYRQSLPSVARSLQIENPSSSSSPSGIRKNLVSMEEEAEFDASASQPESIPRETSQQHTSADPSTAIRFEVLLYNEL
jgi:hypothetical protein